MTPPSTNPPSSQEREFEPLSGPLAEAVRQIRQTQPPPGFGQRVLAEAASWRPEKVVRPLPPPSSRTPLIALLISSIAASFFFLWLTSGPGERTTEIAKGPSVAEASQPSAFEMQAAVDDSADALSNAPALQLADREEKGLAAAGQSEPDAEAAESMKKATEPENRFSDLRPQLQPEGRFGGASNASPARPAPRIAELSSRDSSQRDQVIPEDTPRGRAAESLRKEQNNAPTAPPNALAPQEKTQSKALKQGKEEAAPAPPAAFSRGAPAAAAMPGEAEMQAPKRVARGAQLAAPPPRDASERAQFGPGGGEMGGGLGGTGGLGSAGNATLRFSSVRPLPRLVVAKDADVLFVIGAMQPADPPDGGTLLLGGVVNRRRQEGLLRRVHWKSGDADVLTEIGAVPFAVSPKGDAVVNANGILFQVASRTVTPLPNWESDVEGLLISPKGDLLLTQHVSPESQHCVYRLRSLPSGEKRLEFPNQWPGAFAAAIAPDQSAAAFLDESRVLREYRLSDGGVLRRYSPALAQEATAIEYSPNGAFLVVADAASNILLFRCDRGELLYRLTNASENSGGPISALAFSSDGLLLAASDATRIYIWRIDSGDFLFQSPEGTGSAVHLLFSSDAKTLTAIYDRAEPSKSGPAKFPAVQTFDAP